MDRDIKNRNGTDMSMVGMDKTKTTSSKDYKDVSTFLFTSAAEF